MEKIKLFTHCDLDGVGCSILGKLAFTSIDVSYCNYDKIDELVTKFITDKEYLNYNFVYITDISLKQETIDLINNTKPENFKEGFLLNEMFQLLDHHATAEHLNENFWCEVKSEENDEKVSGTSLFYNDLKENYYLSGDAFAFSEICRKYDTWLWKTKYNDNEPKKWNDLLYILGREDFENYVIDKINSDDLCLDEFALKILELEQRKIDEYIKEKDKTLIVKEILGYQAGVVFSETYTSELGNRLAEMHPELDFIVLIWMKGAISYRTVKDIDLGKDIAKVYGGGGHAKAAGSEFSQDIIENFIDILFKTT